MLPMLEEPDEAPTEHPVDPLTRAREKFDEFRMHAELAAVFEGRRKFDAEILPNLDANLAREIQRTIGRLEKSRSPEHPILPPQSASDAIALLNFPQTRDLSTNDYHLHRRPGEVMIVRWLAGDEVEPFYGPFQANFNAALNQNRKEERQSSAGSRTKRRWRISMRWTRSM